jgi:hypothetical protein
MFVCCVCCVLSGRGLCDGLITRPEESYWRWRVVVCDHETSWTRRSYPALDCRAREKNIIKNVKYILGCSCRLKTLMMCFVLLNPLPLQLNVYCNILLWIHGSYTWHKMRTWCNNFIVICVVITHDLVKYSYLYQVVWSCLKFLTSVKITNLCVFLVFLFVFQAWNTYHF